MTTHASTPSPPDSAPQRRVALLYASAVGALSALAGYATWVNQFRFFINPDSYYYLLIARNILENGHPTGTLGAGGMPFPPQGYAAMKATFPVLVAAVMAVGVPAEAAGHFVASIAAVASVPLAFLAALRLLESRPAALVAALLTATSYGLTYWSGFVMSDSLSVALAFATVWSIARVRRDELSNLGDVGTGLLVALLLLSRPTYAAALPLLFWLGVARFGWTWKRLATSLASAALIVALVSAAWFPPPSFGLRVLLRLAPIVAVALAGVALAILMLRALAEGDRAVAVPPGDASHHPPATWVARVSALFYWALALAVPAVFAAEYALRLAGLPARYPGFDRFVARDAVVVGFVLVGAAALWVARRRDVGGALLASATVMLGVYFWAEPMESRYVIHLLPLLVPVAAATALLPSVARDRSRSAVWRYVAVGVVGAIVAAAALQGARGLTRAPASFLGTDYPSQVAQRLAPALRPTDRLVTALPWPYHFRTGVPSWNAEPSTIERFTRYLPKDAPVVVLVDAALRQHDEALSRAVAEAASGSVVAEFDVPSAYQYGYVSMVFGEPVRAYRITAEQLRELARSVESSADAR